MRTTVMALIVASLVSTGCVTKKKYNELQSQYDELTNQYTALQSTETGLRMEASELEEHITTLRQSNEYLGSFYADLLTEFSSQLEAEQVELILYPDRMSLALAQDVTFASGAAGLTHIGDDTLASLADLVQRHPERRFNVEGHTDDVPIDTARYDSNWDLGAARAVAVVEALISNGVDAKRLAATTYGETQPLAENATDTGRATNRRVEVTYQPTLEELPGHQLLVEAAKRVIVPYGTDPEVVTEAPGADPSTGDAKLPAEPADTRGVESAMAGKGTARR